MPEYQVLCEQCGPSRISYQEYMRQLTNVYSRWKCPVCEQEAEWDDFYGELVERTGEFHAGEYVSFHRETYHLKAFRSHEEAQAHGDRVFLILSDGIEEVL
jgi:hypothetical protein